VGVVLIGSFYGWENAEAERVTPPGVHAFTPAASRCRKWIVVATRRTSYRHIEIFDLQTRKFIPVTASIHPDTNHYNPFISPSSKKIGYHRCRGVDQDADTIINPRLEYQKSPIAGVSLYRIQGSFPEMSPDGSLVAFVNSPNDSASMLMMNLDGSQKRPVYNASVFGIHWSPTRKGIVYGSQGPIFKRVNTSVPIVAIQNADTTDLNVKGTSSSYTFLTKKGTGNNAFPSPSPDGKYIVFRSGRSGFKNLYIMDAEGGEEKYLRQLTKGPWRDTMPVWSPDGEWIAFSSNRLHPIGT
jgi:Tol biopolymer transport system component